MSGLSRIGLIGMVMASTACNTQPREASHADAQPPAVAWAIAVHGGAGSFATVTDPADVAAIEQGIAEAMGAGRDVLAAGGSAMDAVELVVRILEDNPRFNAGKGAVFTADGGHELDASIMDGGTLRCGAVGGVKTVKNPVSLARMVMQRTRHILLAGPDADAWAAAQGVDQVEPGYFFTQKRFDDLQRVLEQRRREQEQGTRLPQPQQQRQGQTSNPAERADACHPPLTPPSREGESAGAPPSREGDTKAGPRSREGDRTHGDDYFGTVGCVARDKHGNLAAATSTGGLTAKMPGRLGDSPIIGAGTYAANDACAVSCTGTGERFIEQAVAFQVAAIMRYRGVGVDEAARIMIHERLKPNEGGLIAVGRDGRIAMPYNTKAMARGAADASGRFEVGLREMQ
jgi:beta-aspartyl-peptidase (threonine type)